MTSGHRLYATAQWWQVLTKLGDKQCTQTSCRHTEFVIVLIKNGIFVVAGTLSYVSYILLQHKTDEIAFNDQQEA